MPAPPSAPKIYHITHVDNLPSIIGEGYLVSDATMISRGGPQAPIGMSDIKQRRLSLPVNCHKGDFVGDYVPFYFCPRSVMLFLIYKRNHPNLTYRGGQEPIVHLEADMHTVLEWANSQDRRWAFSLSNAATYYTQFRNDTSDLAEINWDAVASPDFGTSDLKEGKQAEFLLHGTFPWMLVTTIGVSSRQVGQKAHAALGHTKHRPPVEVIADWYF